MLGHYFLKELDLRSKDYQSVSRSNQHADFQINTGSYSEVRDLLRSVKPSHIINLIGLTSVEDCERDARLSDEVNVGPVLNLAAAREELQLSSLRILHISTDHFYDSPGPSSEDDLKVVNNYAASKLKAENGLDQGRDLIIRTNFVGKSNTPNRESLTDWVVSSCLGVKPVGVLDDVYFSPLDMDMVAKHSLEALFAGGFGVFNLGSRGGMSKAEFDIKFAQALNYSDENLIPISRERAGFLRAPRPGDMTMDSSKFENTFGVSLPSTEELVHRVALTYKQGDS
jgi:dTDP-4-dehydrorhamnose reductase